MSFVKKTVLYALFFFIIPLQAAYAQETIKPILLLENTEGHQFYSFENNQLSLYKIKEQTKYFKTWEYQFLNNKEIELISILSGDIKDGPEKEIIVVLHSFGSKGEVYIFKIKNNKPEGPPEILLIPTTKEGTRPTQAQLINWDQQTKQEILLMCSSPERELLVLDYYNNNLSIITTLATDFLASTYGPIKFFTTDQNKDGVDDVLIYSTNSQVEENIVLSTQEEKRTTLTKQIDFSSIKHFRKTSKKETVCLLNEKKTIYSITADKSTPMLKENIQSIIDVSDKDAIVLTDNNELVIVKPNTQKGFQNQNKKIKLEIQQEKTQYILNPNHTAALFFNAKTTTPTFVFLRPNLTQKKLIKTTQTPTNHATHKATQTIIEKHDTLYVNVGTKTTLSIPRPDSLNIESIETHKKPDTMILNPQTLEFVWTPETQDAGIQTFEYSVSYTSEPKLKQITKNKKQLSLQNTFTTTSTTHRYNIYVNDIPSLIINNPQDTIHATGFFESEYIIKDTYHIEKPTIQTQNNKTNNILINKKTLFWEPGRLDAGEKNFLIIADDGMAQDTVLVSVFVDTTINKIEENTDFIITVNENFTHQLPYTKETNYNIIQGPDNLRISPKGKIHWIPIITQADLNTVIVIEKTTQQQTEHILNIYVNSPPVISYQPALQETIPEGERFQFQFQSFDMNTDAKLQWTNITSSEVPEFIINQFGMLEFVNTEKIDNFRYIIHLSDAIDKDIFIGKLYVNALPEILSTPEKHVQLGETYKYTLITADKNQEKPYRENESNKLYYELETIPEGATFNKNKKTISWTPSNTQIGKNLFKIMVTDSITSVEQEFSVFVNDKPNIVSPDSLSIMLGDTLFHYFDAQDLNQDSELIYTIKTTIDEILFSGKSGKLVWVPQESDLGLHTLEISVSDGFNKGTDIQKLNIFVYKNPILINRPKEEAFVNMEYYFNPKGQDMFGDSIINKDIFFKLLSTDSLFSGKINTETAGLRWVPSIAEIGEQQLLITIIDKYQHKQEQSYPVNVMLSPCETTQPTNPCEGLDTLIINKTDTVEKTIIDSVFIEKKDTVYIDKKEPKDTKDDKWKPKGLGF